MVVPRGHDCLLADVTQHTLREVSDSKRMGKVVFVTVQPNQNIKESFHIQAVIRPQRSALTLSLSIPWSRQLCWAVILGGPSRGGVSWDPSTQPYAL